VNAPPPVCVWLKRDLRVADHAALAAAVEWSRGGAVFAVFLYEPEVFAQPEWDSSHAAFQEECLRDLEPALGCVRRPASHGSWPTRRPARA
jgi:deoxyribodipyrimidine photo-lyase